MRKYFKSKFQPVDWGREPDVLSLETIVLGAISRSKLLSGIYFLIDKNRIVYVGKSTNFYSRFVDHDSGDKVWDRYYFLECELEDMNHLERMYIAHFCPKYNKDKPFRDWAGRNVYTGRPCE